MALLSTEERRRGESVRERFFADADGLRAVEARTRAVDGIVRDRFDATLGNRPGVAAVAVGGYGRCELFPHSDVDLLLLFGSMRDVERSQDEIGTLIAGLWDAKLVVSQSVRTPRDCTSLARDNTELHISLLDTRFVAGDVSFLRELQDGTLPRFYLRERRSLIRALATKARGRHKSFEDTPYHLEPDVKEGPGGLRDIQLACWMAQLEHVRAGRIPATTECLPSWAKDETLDARRFLFSVRCYLHYHHGRDRNVLTYAMQDAIAQDGDAKAYEGSGPDDMMRDYYRRTRSTYRLARRTMDASLVSTNTLASIFRMRKSRLSNREFAVTKGEIYFRDPHAADHSPGSVLRLFEFQARHGLQLSRTAEQRIRTQLPALRRHVESSAGHWRHLREILRLPHTALALSTMRESGYLPCLIPEFALADSLVIRDFYHRYTVDEHTIRAIGVLKDLPGATGGIDCRFASLLAEVPSPELVCLALLYHDLGKGVKGRPHEESSAEMVKAGVLRIGPADEMARKAVVQLVQDHLAMSTIMTKQDMSEPAVLETFKAGVGTLERLNMLTLMTYADTVAVNPLAALQWRKQLLWRLYRRTRSIFERDHGDKRIRPGTVEDVLDLASDADDRDALAAFLRGFPERYARTHTAAQVRRHAGLAADLRPGRATVSSRRREGFTEIVVICSDRPTLFAALCAGISASGADIVSAEAYIREDGLVLDTFRVIPMPGGELLQFGPRGVQQIERRIRALAEGRLDPSDLVHTEPRTRKRPSTGEPPLVTFDNDTSAGSTILSVCTSDRRGLLADLANTISDAGCSIEVVLGHTQGGAAMDTFYLRKDGAKLGQGTCESLTGRLVGACQIRTG